MALFFNLATRLRLDAFCAETLPSVSIVANNNQRRSLIMGAPFLKEVPAVLKCLSANALTAILNAQGTHAPVEVTPIHSHQFCRPRYISVGLFELPLNELSVVSVCCFLEGGKPKRCHRRFLLAACGQISGGHFYSWVHDHNSLNSVPQLANIPRPGVILELCHRFRRKLFRLFTVWDRKLLIEVLRQKRNIFRTISQWG